jgi:uncharacterized protein with PQ loop repeat
MLPSDCVVVERQPDAKLFDRVLRLVSIVTMLMTVPQAVTVWTSHSADGVSLVSWMAYLLAACLWLVYGLRKRDKTITWPASAESFWMRRSSPA